MTGHALAILTTAALFIIGCHRSPEAAQAGQDAAPAAALSNAADAADAAPNARAAAAAPKTGEPAKPVPWIGTYKSGRGGFHVPEGPEYAGVKWRGDESTEGLGEGNLELTIDSVTGQAIGALEGPLGPAILYGSLQGDTLAATISRKDIGDRGFTGTLYAKGTLPHTFEGTMKLSLHDARVIREARFNLKRKD